MQYRGRRFKTHLMTRPLRVQLVALLVRRPEDPTVVAMANVAAANSGNEGFAAADGVGALLAAAAPVVCQEE